MDWVSVLIDVLKAILAAIAAGFMLAHVGFRYFIRQKQHEKQLEIAERAMKTFVRAAEVIGTARVVYAYDSSVVPRGNGRAYAAKYGQIIESFDSNRSVFEEVREVAAITALHLGHEAGFALRDLDHIRLELTHSVLWLSALSPDEITNYDSDRETELVSLLSINWFAPGKKDEISERIDFATQTLERSCERYLHGLRQRRMRETWRFRRHAAVEWLKSRRKLLVGLLLLAVVLGLVWAASAEAKCNAWKSIQDGTRD